LLGISGGTAEVVEHKAELLCEEAVFRFVE
jgi:F0F1-type ATP synthase epsilon subunit